MVANPDRVLIFDTTLRDGEQSPGCSMTRPEKLRVARALAELGVDVIEAGFPAASRGDFESVEAVAREVQGPIICGLARCNPDDIDLVAQAVKDAPHKRIHVFLATSAIHRQYKLNMAQDEILRLAATGVARARELCEDVEFSPEDASRTEIEFLAQVVETAIAAGATTVNIPDTVGYAIPSEFAMLVGRVVDLVGSGATISVHCHNDLGLATANTLAAVQAGARQVEVTINGLGERAGNASLEEVVMALRTRPTQFPELLSRVQTEHITTASRLVSHLTGFAIQPNKAVVGANAFAHESGIHQDGVIKNPLTYEIMTPQSVGLSGSQLTIGKLSGRKGLQKKLHDLGHDVSGDALDIVYREAIALADVKKEVTDADLQALVQQRAGDLPASIVLDGWSVTSSHGGKSTGSVRLALDGEERAGESTGNGPVNALYRAVDEAIRPVVGWEPTLVEYEIKAVTEGEDAQGRVFLRCRRSTDAGDDAIVVTGHGLSTNIIEASLEAYVVAANKLWAVERDEATLPVLRPSERLP